MDIIENEKKLDIIYFVKKGDTLNSISNKFCVDVMSIRKDNGMSNGEDVEEGDILWIKQKNSFCHIVKPAETINDIAKKYKVTVEYIRKNNNIDNIFIGQKLFI